MTTISNKEEDKAADAVSDEAIPFTEEVQFSAAVASDSTSTDAVVAGTDDATTNALARTDEEGKETANEETKKEEASAQSGADADDSGVTGGNENTPEEDEEVPLTFPQRVRRNLPSVLALRLM